MQNLFFNGIPLKILDNPSMNITIDKQPFGQHRMRLPCAAASIFSIRYPIFARMGGVGEMQLDVHFTQTVTI